MAEGVEIYLGFANADGGGFNPDCRLTPESFSVEITRSPSIVGLPNQNGSNRGNFGHGSGVPRNILIDFGMMQETISIQGKIPDLDQSEINNNLVLFLSKMRTQWVNMPTILNMTDSANGNGLVKVRVVNYVATGTVDMTWGCTIMRFSIDRAAGTTYWDYRIVLGVVKYPEETSGYTP